MLRLVRVQSWEAGDASSVQVNEKHTEGGSFVGCPSVEMLTGRVGKIGLGCAVGTLALSLTNARFLEVAASGIVGLVCVE